MDAKWKDVQIRDVIWFSDPPIDFGHLFSTDNLAPLDGEPRESDGACIVVHMQPFISKARNSGDTFKIFFVKVITSTGVRKSLNVFAEETVRGVLHKRRT
jgi:hypothetical protein